MIIAIEGMDYVGKSTQIQLLKKFFEDKGHPVQVLSSLSGEVREKFLSPDTTPYERLFLGTIGQRDAATKIYAFHEEHPNGVTILDRWVSSSYIYQVLGHGVPSDYWEIANQSRIPVNHLICIHMDKDEYLKRVAIVSASSPDRVGSDVYEKMLGNDNEFQHRIWEGYEWLVNEPSEIVRPFITTANESSEDLSKRITEALCEEEPLEQRLINKEDIPNDSGTILIGDASRGVYLPHFVISQIISDADNLTDCSGTITDVKRFLTEFLELEVGSDHYWDDWQHIIDCFVLHIDGYEYQFYQDQDVWLYCSKLLTEEIRDDFFGH